MNYDAVPDTLICSGYQPLAYLVKHVYSILFLVALHLYLSILTV